MNKKNLLPLALLAYTIPALATPIAGMILSGLIVFIVMSTIIIGLISYIEILILKKMGTYIDKNKIYVQIKIYFNRMFG